MKKKLLIKRVAEIVHYGLQWVEDDVDAGRLYIIGAVEAVGHQAACCICQWFNLGDGVPTAETIEALQLFKFPSRKRLEKLVENYIKALTE